VQLFHTSPAEITAISGVGRFGSHLFFSDRVYYMAMGHAVVYSVEIDENDVISAREIYYRDDLDKIQPVIDRVIRQFGVDDDVALDLICERSDVSDLDDVDDPGEASWVVQGYTAQAAALLGFRAVKVTDESGTSYMIDMAGRLADLKAVDSE
jgi:hypothetical protein